MIAVDGHYRRPSSPWISLRLTYRTGRLTSGQTPEHKILTRLKEPRGNIYARISNGYSGPDGSCALVFKRPFSTLACWNFITSLLN